MRVTARQVTNSYIFNTNKNYGKVAEQFEKLQTGRGYTRLSQNIPSGKKALKIRTAIYRNEQYKKNASAANEQITAAEESLTGINEQIQNVKALAEKALNGTNTDETSRKIFQSTLEETKNAICDGLNVKYLEASGRASVDPVADNKTQSGRSKNRRVEIKIYSNND